MKLICRNSLTLLWFFFSLYQYSLFAQEKNPTKWPYGGIPDSSRYNEVRMVIPLNFADVNFNEERFDSEAIFRLSHFTNSARFGFANFQKYADFSYAHFFEKVDFQGAVFEEQVNWSYFESNKTFDCSNVTFRKKADFRRSIFNDIVYFDETTFKGNAYLSLAKFNKAVYFQGTEFNNKVDFSYTEFRDEVYFSESNFDKIVKFKGTVDFEHTRFTKGVDFRRARFDSVKFIYLYGIKFPEGKFRIYWDQIKGKDSLRIRLSKSPYSSDLSKKVKKKEQFQRIETIYHQLRDNFLAQGNNSDADAVMYELSQQKERIIGSIWWKIYGLTFGYGYKPWKFILYIIIPIIILFSILWYAFYYGIIAIILNEKLEDGVRKDINELKPKTIKLFRKYNLMVYDHRVIDKNVKLGYRIWHSIFFSASVLLSVRWKREWIDIPTRTAFGTKSYVWILSIQYFLGILLYILFAVCVKGGRFEYAKGLFGF